MLAIISDLHFCDGTATNRNVHPAAFALALGAIYEQAKPIVDKLGAAQIDLVLLGDVFDLLRTERWFEDADGAPVPLAGRPWGEAEALDKDYKVPEAVLLRARAILEKVIEVNAEALAILKGKGKPDGITVRRILLPGNHDRLALHDEALYARMREAVGATDERKLSAEGIYRHHLAMRPYGVLARHGHEWDAWNFEAYEEGRDPSTYADEDYLAAPIGDPITTELVARLPYAMKKRLAGESSLSDADKHAVYRHLQHIEDVRPVFASIQWAYAQVSTMGGMLGNDDKGRIVHAAGREVIKALAGEFRDLPFYKAWAQRHHRLFHFDYPDQLGAALTALEIVTPDTIEKIASVFGKVLDAAQDDDPYRAAAGTEELAPVGDDGLRFVVYGHTHDPVEAALSASFDAADVYLNSGTFRQRIFRTDDKKGFVDSEHISYLSFFREDEAATWRDGGHEGRPGRAYAAWMGSRSR